MIFVLCVPEDYDRAAELVDWLEAAGYDAYLEPPDITADDTQRRETTSEHFYAASVLLAMISEMSALGPSADVFDSWWRTFKDKEPGGKIIPCIAPDAPSGEKNWMPFDLARVPRADLRQPDGYDRLRDLLHRMSGTKSSISVTAVPEPTQAVSRALVPLEEPPREFQVKAPPPDPPTPPPLPVKKTQKATLSTGVLNLLAMLGMLTVIGGAWLMLWQLTGDRTFNPMIFYPGLGIVAAGCFLLLIRYAARGQKEYQASLQKPVRRHKKGQKTGYTRQMKRPQIYIEVLESAEPEDVGLILPVLKETVTIGRAKYHSLTLKDRTIERDHCQIGYQVYEGRYYLENLNHRKQTVLFAESLAPGETHPVQNGDLIALGKSVVLQFRVHQD